jgi:hypothetical protein
VCARSADRATTGESGDVGERRIELPLMSRRESCDGHGESSAGRLRAREPRARVCRARERARVCALQRQAGCRVHSYYVHCKVRVRERDSAARGEERLRLRSPCPSGGQKLRLQPIHSVIFPALVQVRCPAAFVPRKGRACRIASREKRACCGTATAARPP